MSHTQCSSFIIIPRILPTSKGLASRIVNIISPATSKPKIFHCPQQQTRKTPSKRIIIREGSSR